MTVCVCVCVCVLGLYIYIYMCVCVCVWRETERGNALWCVVLFSLIYYLVPFGQYLSPGALSFFLCVCVCVCLFCGNIVHSQSFGPVTPVQSVSTYHLFHISLILTPTRLFFLSAFQYFSIILDTELHSTQKYFYRYSKSRGKADYFEGRNDSGVTSSRFTEEFLGSKEHNQMFASSSSRNAHAKSGSNHHTMKYSLLENCLATGNPVRPDMTTPV